MADKANSKRRKIAKQSLQVELTVPEDEAHEVGNEQFDDWNDKVRIIFEDTSKKIAIESAKFAKSASKTQKPLKIKGEMEPFIWRQTRIDTNAQ